jgi:hypothetical protein
MGKGCIAIALIILVFCFSVWAQSHDLDQTGYVRPVVSEIQAAAGPTVQLGETGFRIRSNIKKDFYFVYTAPGKQEQWIALPNDRDWSELSNQAVRLKARLRNNKLSDLHITPLTTLSREQLVDPPPTTGLYKIVAVPLTIQPQASTGDLLGVSAEAIRNVLFNHPNSVNKFYNDASYGMFRFAGVHHPQVDVVPVTIQATISSNCQDQIVTQFTPIVRQRLLENNIDTTNGSVDIGVIIFNDLPGCPNYPFTTRGALGVRGVPLWLWMPESWFVTGPAIMAHEIGHCLGANHPNALRCTDFDDQQTCENIPNAADRDMMTYAASYYLMPNNYERLRWGWHPQGAFDDPSTEADHAFNLHSPVISPFKDGFRDRRFYFRYLSGAWAGGWAIFPEARRNWGLFERYDGVNDSFRLGISVRIGHLDYGHPEALSILLDPNATMTLDDAPLREDQQVTIGGITVQALRDHNPAMGTRVRVRTVP